MNDSNKAPLDNARNLECFGEEGIWAHDEVDDTEEFMSLVKERVTDYRLSFEEKQI
jgi:hypothetical protein